MARNNYLLDTHCLIWFQENNPKIPSKVLQVLSDPNNIIYFSQISLYEIAIKQSIGKLPDFKAELEDIYRQAIKDNFTYIPISNSHIFKYRNIPLLEQHRDPFDRLLIATTHEEDFIVISCDEKFLLYPGFVKVFWQ